MPSANNMQHVRIVAFTIVGFVAAAAAALAAVTSFRRKIKIPSNIAPRVEKSHSGRIKNIERFSHYLARQLGIRDANECHRICKLADDYLRKSRDVEASFFEYFSSEADADSLFTILIEELDLCILSYFAFNWSQSDSVITQVLSVDSDPKRRKFKDLVLSATRKARFERASKTLKVTRVFSTLVEEMKAIGGDSQIKDVMVPVAHDQRSPVLLFMGGGMGAGKSTVLQEILKGNFWLAAAANAVVVEADAFKESDVIYRHLSSSGHHSDMLHLSELVHPDSKKAAWSLLVTALNEGRDVILDGTLSRASWVEQTIAMARNVHNCRYRIGTSPGVCWEQVDAEEDQQDHQKIDKGEAPKRKPYRIELVGVVCDAYLAVARGIRRGIMIGRQVPVRKQIESHMRFAKAFYGYCQLVDSARLFSTNVMAAPPMLIAWKEGDSKLLVDPEQIKCLTNLCSMNADADNIFELYMHNPSLILEPGSFRKDSVLSPSRPSAQLKLKDAIEKIEQPIKLVS